MTDEFATDERTDWWNEVYGDHESPPWETGEPQPALVDVADEHVRGRVLDVGCGLGTEARYLAEAGHAVLGVDFSETAIERAREIATGECHDATLGFEIADAGAGDRGNRDVRDGCGLRAVARVRGERA